MKISLTILYTGIRCKTVPGTQQEALYWLYVTCMSALYENLNLLHMVLKPLEHFLIHFKMQLKVLLCSSNTYNTQ